MNVPSAVDRLLRKHPWIALVGVLVPPIWALGVIVMVALGIVTVVRGRRVMREYPSLDLDARLRGPSLIVSSPLWPWLVYDEYRSDPADWLADAGCGANPWPLDRAGAWRRRACAIPSRRTEMNVYSEVADLVRKAGPAEQWELRIERRWARYEIVLCAVHSGRVHAFPVASKRREQLRDQIAEAIEQAGGSIVASAPRPDLPAAERVPFIVAVLFAVMVALGYESVPRIVVELGICVTLLMVIHELALIGALHFFGVPASLLAHVPRVRGLFGDDDREAEGWVSLAAVGIGAGLGWLTIVLYLVSGHAPALLIALISLALNGLNLLPVWPFGGNSTVAAMLLKAGLILAGLATWCAPQLICLLILGLGLISAVDRLRPDARRRGTVSAPRASGAQICVYLVVWLLIVGGLAFSAARTGEALDLIAAISHRPDPLGVPPSAALPARVFLGRLVSDDSPAPGRERRTASLVRPCSRAHRRTIGRR